MKKTFRGIAPLIIVLIIIFFSISVMMDKKDDTKLTYNELLSAIQTMLFRLNYQARDHMQQ